MFGTIAAAPQGMLAAGGGYQWFVLGGGAKAVLYLSVVAALLAIASGFVGLLIGGSVSSLFSALAIRTVSRTAGVVVQEVRNQFAAGKIMSGERLPDDGPVIDICTKASLRELATPVLLAVLTPVTVALSNIDENNSVVSTPKPAGLAIAGVSLVVLVGAVVYLKRGTEMVAATPTPEPVDASV